MTLPNPTQHNEITAGLWLQYTWRPSTAPNPACRQSAAEWKRLKAEEERARQALQAEIREACPEFDAVAGDFDARFSLARCVRQARTAQPAVPMGSWPGWYDASDMIAIAMGAPEPLFMNGMWWHDRNHYALEKIDSAAEVARLKVPEWSSADCVQRMFASRDRWQRECPDEPASGFGSQLRWDNLVVPGRGEVTVLCYPSFVDLGLFLMGATRFFTVLAGEAELADALLELCFELSTSYIDFLYAQQPFAFAGLAGFGGDATFFLSPALFERYSAAWDSRLFAYVRAKYKLPADLPCNYHSCGASAHLYEKWGRHPHRDNIAALQTRLIPGTVGRLRAALPNVELELTLHPPQFDLAHATPGEIREVMLTTAHHAGARNLHFSFITAAHRPAELPLLARNIRVCHELMEELSN